MSEIIGPVGEINYNEVAVSLSAGGGGKLYNHQISFAPAKKGSVTIVNSSPELFTNVTLPKWLYEKGYKGLSSKAETLAKQSAYPVINKITIDTDTISIPVGIYSTDNTQIGLYSHKINISTSSVENEYNDEWYSTTYGLTDTVSEV